MTIIAEHLTKAFKKKKVVDDVSVQVGPGQIYGLLGPNAAGKTTLIRMLCGLITADDGSVQINDLPIKQAKSHFGYVAQYFSQYEELTVWENIQFYAELYGVKDKQHLHQLMEHYQLLTFKNIHAGDLSGGYQRRLALVCALVHNPDVLFLDEPTSGIDPVTRKQLWDDFYALSAEGKTLFVTTHYMEEAQRCHELAFMAHGRVVATGTPVTIKDNLGDVNVYVAELSYNPDVQARLISMQGVQLVNQFGTELRIVTHPEVAIQTIEKEINTVSDVKCILVRDSLNMEDVFIALTQDVSHQEVHK